MKPKQATIRLTEQELWELINNFGQSFEAGGEGNETADRVMEKLNEAFQKLRDKG